MSKIQIEKNPISVNIGKNIRYFRRMQDITQAQLGKYFNLSSQQMHKYENGDHDISCVRLLKIAEILKTSLADLLKS